MQDIARHLIRALQGVSHHELSEISGDVIVIADDLTPSDAVRFGRQGVVGFAIESGGRTSHTTIIAHSLNIPLVTGLPGITRLAAHEDPVIVDGTAGVVVLHPTAAVIDEYERRQRDYDQRTLLLLATRELETRTRDGVAVQLMANIDLVEEVAEARRYGAQGIGLYRSEFLYIERTPELPSEDDHYALYRRLVEEMAPHPVIIRTYDLGGRKLAREVMDTREENPVLGLRGIRLTLARPQVFRTQLRGLFRAGAHGDLWVLLPMVSTVEEVRAFRAFGDEVRRELAAEGVPHCERYRLGVMIEVPSAALIADHLAAEVDFFAIGTNDLIQYSLAVDRNNEHVTHLYQPLHPAMLRMLRFVVEQADEHGIPVSVCGEMAADPLAAAVLVGLGHPPALAQPAASAGDQDAPARARRRIPAGARAPLHRPRHRRRRRGVPRVGAPAAAAGRPPRRPNVEGPPTVLNPVRRVDKPWGYELVFAHTDRYVGKLLHVDAGHALSLQYHERKDETLYLAAGSMEFQVEEDGELVVRELRLGEAYHIPPHTRHRMIAGPEGCDLVEVSTPELEDVVRLEDRYGRA